MNMKYDSSVMNGLVKATEARIVDAYNAFIQINNTIKNTNTSQWNDKKRTEFEELVTNIGEELKTSAQKLNNYLEYLKQKMIDFENRG